MKLKVLENLNFNRYGVKDYWENRYKSGGRSGNGSYGSLAIFKAKIINKFLQKENIKSCIEWGCGDGNQLKLIDYSDYIGIDISKTAIKRCKKIFYKDISKKFYELSELPSNFFTEEGEGGIRDLSISLDVIFHLVEDEVYEEYMKNLFNCSNKFVCIYSSNYNSKQEIHIKHRKFTDYVQNNFKCWSLYKKVRNIYDKTVSFSDFYFYKKQ